MTILQRECCLFIGEAESLGLGPKLDDVGRRDAGPYGMYRGIQDLTAVFVGVNHGLRSDADGKGAVVAGAVAVIAMQDIKVGWISLANCSITENMWMRAASLSRDRIYSLNLLRAH